MNKLLLTKNIIVRSFLIYICLFSNNVHADCDTTAPMHYPTLNDTNYQGSAHTDSFDCAINGTRQLTLEEINERNSYLPPNLNNRFYLRIGANAAAEGITGVQNKGANNSVTNAQGTLQTTKNTIADNNFELAFGYTWSEFAVDLEWLASKSIPYTTAVNDVTPSFTVNSTIKGDAILANIFWIFNDMYNVKLYGDFIVGLSKNNSTNYINVSTVSTNSRTHWAFGLGIGGRFNVISKAYADVCARAIYLGTAKIVATNGVEAVYLKAKRTWLGIGVCLVWLF